MPSWISETVPSGGVAIIGSKDAHAVFESLGLSETPLPLLNAKDSLRSASAFAVCRYADKTFVVETNGRQLTRPVVSALLSRFGPAGAVSWSPETASRVALARQARTVLTGFLGRRFRLRGDSDLEDVELRELTKAVSKQAPSLVELFLSDVISRYIGVQFDQALWSQLLGGESWYLSSSPPGDDHSPVRRLVDGTLDPIICQSNLGIAGLAMNDVSGVDLRELAWWIAERIAEYNGRAEHPIISAAVRSRSMSAMTIEQLRKGRIDGYLSLTLRAVYGACNPDPPTAVIDALSQFTFPQNSTEESLVRVVRDRILFLRARGPDSV